MWGHVTGYFLVIYPSATWRRLSISSIRLGLFNCWASWLDGSGQVLFSLTGMQADIASAIV